MSLINFNLKPKTARIDTISPSSKQVLNTHNQEPKVIALVMPNCTTTKFGNVSLHPMLTRTKRRHLLALRKLCFLSEVVPKEPISVHEALNDPRWFKAIEVKFDAFIKN